MVLEILYEDNHLIAANKPSGILVQGDKTGDESLLEKVKAYLKKKYNKPGDVFLGLPHRLDRPVSGIVLMARTSKALSRLNEIFKNREIQKTYWALVDKQPNSDSGILTHFLIKDNNKNRVCAYDYQIEGSKKAELHYSIKEKYTNSILLEVKPITGRPHQIRVQLSKIGCHIVGDLKYGFPKPNSDASICLHAASLEFIHPIQKIPVKIEAPLPTHPRVWKS